MDPRVIFLGTGGDIFVTGQQLRASGGIVLQAEGNQFHIDPGPGAVVRARIADINPRHNTAIFVSHNHLNHCNDINALISAMTHNGFDKKGVVITNKTAYNGIETMKPVMTEYYKRLVERAIAVEAGQKIAINEIEIKATPTRHNDPHAVGFKFFAPKFTLGYTSDTEYFKELAEEFKETDLLIINVVNPFHIKEKNHMNSEDAVKLINEAKPKHAVITHFGIKMHQADPLYEAREISKQTSTHVLAAKDGLVLNPMTFASSVRQKTLKGF
ncbi:hypothetical protein D6745_00655 [Candidatus Woesearchaeota archaeon]|nr:MAG: hypothetical protein D6745_00655 [Candidatus Woesearchaeota archaeon]